MKKTLLMVGAIFLIVLSGCTIMSDDKFVVEMTFESHQLVDIYGVAVYSDDVNFISEEEIDLTDFYLFLSGDSTTKWDDTSEDLEQYFQVTFDTQLLSFEQVDTVSESWDSYSKYYEDDETPAFMVLTDGAYPVVDIVATGRYPVEEDLVLEEEIVSEEESSVSVVDFQLSLKDALTDCGALDLSMYVEKEGATGAFSYWTEEESGGGVASTHWYNHKSDEFYAQYQGDMLDFAMEMNPYEWEVLLGFSDIVASAQVDGASESDEFKIRWFIGGDLYRNNIVNPVQCSDGNYYISGWLLDDGDELASGDYTVEIFYNGEVLDSTTLTF